MARLQRSKSLNERDQGRRALKNRRLPLAHIVRAFSALLERCNQKGYFTEKRKVQQEGFSRTFLLTGNQYTEVKIAIVWPFLSMRCTFRNWMASCNRPFWPW
jgi:hypothetical protein